ncbi:linker for activation of T-cells family member 1 [Suncus etruscus]|uniref:linker for activation of T-cells family member 1 n=1 Tax=Suncus etruscus TaxID=109475 RepID=UPI00210F91A8|nr:linker for activation of T-cells family member 1 [Suncus etruscus]
MDTAVPGSYELGLVLLPLLAVLLALCLRCRDLQSSCDDRPYDERSLVMKPPPIFVPCPPAIPHPPVAVPSHLDLGPLQLLGGSHEAPSSLQDSDGADSVPSYENENPWEPEDWAGGGAGPDLLADPPVMTPGCSIEVRDEDEEEDNNGGYLMVLPDDVPASGTVAQPAPSKPGLRDSAFSMESGDDYVNVPDSGESADASLDGSQEYVNVSQELHPAPSTEPATPSFHEAKVEDEEDEEEEEEEEEGPSDYDYENLQLS